MTDWVLHARWVLASREQAGRARGMTRWDERDLAFYEAHAQYIATGRRQRVSMARNGQWLVRSVGSKSVVPVDERRWTFHTFMGE